jgi:enoyl-CoA hydratase
MTEVGYSVTDGVAVISLEAHSRRNALGVAIAEDLIAAVERVDADDSVGALVLTGGPTFCAGADRDVMRANSDDPSLDANYRAIETIYSSFVRVAAAKVPTVAAVRGAAIGGGLNLAMATDIRIVGHETRIVSGFSSLGLHPGGGHFVLLHSLVGREATAALGVFGDEIDGRRAVELGLAWKSVDDREVDAVALSYALRAAKDPELARRVVASMRREIAPPGLPWDAGLEVERAPQMWSFRRWDAFRAPTFKKPR